MHILEAIGAVLGLIFLALCYPWRLFGPGAKEWQVFAVAQGAPYRLWAVPRWFARAFRWVTRPLYGETVDAITLGHVVIFLSLGVDGRPDLQLERHELEHVLQAVRLEPRWWPALLGRRAVGVLRHWVAYLIEYARVGYWNNRFEREARIAAHQEDPS